MSEHNAGAVTAAPFLNHTVLTPAQREFVRAVAASHSAAHARRLITQHYRNVLHSCIQTGSKPERENDADATDESLLHHREAPKEKSKKLSGRGRYQSPNRRPKTTSSKQIKMKTFTSSSHRNQGGGIRPLSEGEPDGLDASVIKFLESLSVGDDTVSNIAS